MTTPVTPVAAVPVRRSRQRIILTVVGIVLLLLLCLGLKLGGLVHFGFGRDTANVSAAVGTNATAPSRPAAPAAAPATSEPAPSASADTPSADPSASDANAAGVPAGNSDKSCNPVALPAHWLGVTVKLPATADGAYTPLAAFQAHHANAVAYSGEPVSLDAVGEWICTVTRNSMSPMVFMDPFFNKLGIAGGKDFASKLVQAHPGAVSMWVLEQNNGSSNPGTASFNERALALKAAAPDVRVLVITDKFTSVLSENIAAAGAYNNANLKVTGYYPYTGSKKYGTESDLSVGAKTAKHFNNDGATAAVQDFDWWSSLPDEAASWGFAKKTLAAGDVGRMVHTVHANGANCVLLITLEGDKDSADDVNWVTSSLDAASANMN